MEQGTNTRFLVGTRKEGPKDLYEFYVKRGESENWIKDFKLHIKADRLSCSRFMANQFRLLLHACAYWLMDTLRRKLVASGARRMQLDTLQATPHQGRREGQGAVDEGPHAPGLRSSRAKFVAHSLASLRKRS